MRITLPRLGLGALALAAALLSGDAGDPSRTAAAGWQTPDEGPAGWLLAGTTIADYTIDLDPAGGRRGEPCPKLASAVAEPRGFAGIAKLVDAAPYRGRRLAFTAFVRARDVTGRAGLFLRVDTPERRAWAIDTMQDRPIEGSLDWQAYRIVLEVPPEASEICYGALLEAGGSVWVDGTELGVVGAEVPTTEPAESALRRRGLDFEPEPALPRR